MDVTYNMKQVRKKVNAYKTHKITQEVIGEWLHETIKGRFNGSMVVAKHQYKTCQRSYMNNICQYVVMKDFVETFQDYPEANENLQSAGQGDL